ncbi:MAG: hypothetical protein WC675_00495 [Patescibacteria group bacterium]|jgi:hypothetical protein
MTESAALSTRERIGEFLAVVGFFYGVLFFIPGLAVCVLAAESDAPPLALAGVIWMVLPFFWFCRRR